LVVFLIPNPEGEAIMIPQLNVRIFFLSALVCLASGSLFAMDDKDKKTGPTGPAKTWTEILTKNRVTSFGSSFFNGWIPTLVGLVGVGAYWAKYDHQAPSKALAWATNTFNETHWTIKYPALLLGTCVAGEYYLKRVKPLAEDSWTWIKNKVS
jgi:hypothetical protein